MERCDTCKFWYGPMGAEGTGMAQFGVCRRHAPAPKWPVVQKTAWCGDYKTNEADGFVKDVSGQVMVRED